MIRRPSLSNDTGIFLEENEEDLTPCPISDQLIPEMDLESPVTKEAIPMCICTGKHMIIDDWSFCPASGLPVLYSEYINFIKSDNNIYNNSAQMECNSSSETSHAFYTLDPICGLKVSSFDVKKVSHAIENISHKMLHTSALTHLGYFPIRGRCSPSLKKSKHT